MRKLSEFLKKFLNIKRYNLTTQNPVNDKESQVKLIFNGINHYEEKCNITRVYVFRKFIIRRK